MSSWIGFFLRGMGMGAADVIPGVSGGTIAFIVGIYERWIDALKRLDIEALRLLFQGRWHRLWRHIDGNFLVPLFAGIGTAVLLLSKVIKYLMAAHPVPLWAFFWGLIAASAWMVRLRIRRWNATVLLIFFGGMAFAAWISAMAPTQRPGSYLELFGSGAVAISAMMLPGISGSYILMVLGKYEQAIHSVAAVADWLKSLLGGGGMPFPSQEVGVLVALMAGILLGFVVFSRLLSWLLHHHHDPTLAALMGFMLGSLYKVWPWKMEISGRMVGYVPGWSDPHFLSGIAWIGVGMAVVWLLARWAPPEE